MFADILTPVHEEAHLFQISRLWVKLALAMTTAFAVVIGILITSSVINMNRVINEAERSALEAHFQAIKNDIVAQSRAAEALSTLVASLPPVQEKFAQGDRKAMIEMFSEAMRVLSQDYGIEQFQFHTPPATSWLRMHKVEQFGDDLSAFRKSVVDTNRTQTANRGLEGGVAGLGVRGVVPVMANGKHLGSVEFGGSFGQTFFDNFKSQNGIDAALVVPDKDTFKTIASTVDKNALASQEVVKAALAGEAQLFPRQIKGVPYAVYAAPVMDFSGKPIGVVELFMDSSRYQDMLNSSLMTALLLGLLAMLGGALLSIVIAKQMTKRIQDLVVGVNRVAQGDLSVEITVVGNDEIAELAKATRDMREKLHALATQVRHNAILVLSAAQEITGAVEGQAATSSEMSSSVAEITSTMEELSASSTQIADYSKSVVLQAKQTLDGSRSGSESMQSVLERMRDIRANNQENLKEILDLGTKSKQISKVMEIIYAVADQTKLIAFNAALEASSAGEAGKRFSVVAGEIRRLADSVTESTEEIEGKISEIQGAISRLVLSTEKGDIGVENGLAATVATAERLDIIVEAAQQTSTAAQQISLSTQQQKTASGQVVVALREIVTASTHTAQSITRISQVSREMSTLSTQLNDATSQFKVEHQDKAA